jgi:hypothetical protein
VMVILLAEYVAKSCDIDTALSEHVANSCDGDTALSEHSLTFVMVILHCQNM